MTTAVHDDRAGTGAGRARLQEAALRLFAEHGVSGTSLQMIADDVGVTKAAVYHHYKTKDEIVLGVVTPLVERLQPVLEDAQAKRGRRAQVEAVLEGLVDLVIDARRVYRVMASDPCYPALAAHEPLLQGVGEGLVALLSGPEPDEETCVTVNLFLMGLVGPLRAPDCADVADDTMRRTLLDLGRRLLLPRRAARA
ncbi:TetR/AcrR family transcriptional regulator [Kineococcus rubinsiae]|uniref:TetR/AcrR family transcriptional regulator n=1 Tax=Kineococcus rubinsiae TaxID=2609562 RepID=UPI001430CD01|nr:TetR/AcrR family transcriptional regulator [Kineococcus rubinsiae]